MKYFFVSYAFTKRDLLTFGFGWLVTESSNDVFDVVYMTKVLCEKEDTNAVTILNWKEITKDEWRLANERR